MMSQATVYLIRHGEKPPTGDNLSVQGVERSQALPQVFGQDSQYNIGHIMAERPKAKGNRARPFDTVKPLANDLGLDVDISCERDDSNAVADAVHNYTGSGNILICWEHGQLQNIAKALGVADAPKYPGERFDLIYTIPPPYTEIISTTSENTELDKDRPKL